MVVEITILTPVDSSILKAAYNKVKASHKNRTIISKSNRYELDIKVGIKIKKATLRAIPKK